MVVKCGVMNIIGIWKIQSTPLTSRALGLLGRQGLESGLCLTTHYHLGGGVPPPPPWIQPLPTPLPQKIEPKFSSGPFGHSKIFSGAFDTN